eukprot:TRINITY_DN3507_c0_g1_i1.p1 TRINITY_DN3507_c0_g1~~TRINITY_DN3507_c0_g1_i1.p1  ORF type:complete len:1225 (-),score=456.01 TRINITY_DN3507_c0_g1_i1:489-4163(-)
MPKGSGGTGKTTPPPPPSDDFSGEDPLPAGWDLGRDYDGKVYYINHLEKRTTWSDPRLLQDSKSSHQQQQHHSKSLRDSSLTSSPPPSSGGVVEISRDEWKAVQESMLKQYLASAEIDLRAKEELAEIKEQRLSLARDEYLHLSNRLNMPLSSSTSSLNSTGSCLSTKYDPDLLRADVIHAKSRVQRLKRELVNIDSEMAYKQRGVETLSRVNDKFAGSQIPAGITLEEAQAIKLELYNIHQSLSCGEMEKVELMKSLACLKDDLTRLQPSESSLDVSSLESRLSTASQTDLSGEIVPVGTRLAEMARLRLRYDDARRRVQEIQQSLASLEEKMNPGQLESDKDRLLLIQEKEQLLRELRSITPRSRSNSEMIDIQKEILKLENDLNKAMEVSNRCIADRLRLHEEKQILLGQLLESMKSVSRLESQLKLLSASTLSMSSSSSLGSLSSSHASSKGSLCSLSFTDIYGLSTSASLLGGDPNMLDLHKRVDKILQGSATAPSQEEQPQEDHQLSSSISQQHLEKTLSELSLGGNSSSKNITSQQQLPSISEGGLHFCSSAELSTISESNSEAPTEEDATSGVNSAPFCVAAVSAPPPPRVSAPRASSDESVAGDSGVFEAAGVRVPMTSSSSSCSNQSAPAPGLSLMNLETAQVQIKLKYFTSESILQVGIERARNLSALLIPKKGKICVKAALLPFTSTNSSFCCTRVLTDLRKPPAFGESFPLAVPIKKLTSQTLQITIWSSSSSSSGGGKEECLGSAMVSLADFDPSKGTCLKWYNVLSFHFMQQPGDPAAKKLSAEFGSSNAAVASSSSRLGALLPKEESSDDSTIISSQTSTLTRNLDVLIPREHPREETYQEEEVERQAVQDNVILCASMTPKKEEEGSCSSAVRDVSDKETNTEQTLLSSHSSSPCKRTIQQRMASSEALIKRSQTFSPTASTHLDKNDYICRLNRSDSDSAMPLYKRLSFQRSMSERRSLRVPFSSSRRALRQGGHHSSHHPKRRKSSSRVMQTPLDLELDLAAQKTKLELLQEEIDRLKVIKRRMEEARENGDKELPNWLADQDHFQRLLSQVELNDQKSSEDRKFEKMVRKSGRDIYKLRKTRTPKGKLDVHSFKEKMTFFTSLKTSVPILPVPEEDLCSEREVEGDDGDFSYESSTKNNQGNAAVDVVDSSNSLNDDDESAAALHPSLPSSSSSSEEEEKKSGGGEQKPTKFTYEIDPVIGVIV